MALPAGSAAAKTTTVKVKGKLRTDGALTVNQPETLRLKGMPPSMNLDLLIEPPDDLNSCFDILPGTCLPTPLYPAPGSPAFRTSGRGRATLTFVMPRSYRFMSSSSLPEFQVPARPFRDGQIVWIRAKGSKRIARDGSKIVVRGTAVGRGVVWVPPGA